MKNLKRKLLLASIVCCGSVALGFGSLNNASVAVSANTLDGFEVKSASLRIPDETYGKGIRFTVGLGNVTLAEGATSGVLLIPASSLGADELTLGLENQDLKTSEITWKTTDNGKEAYVHLYGVPETQYATDISMRAYIDHDADSKTAPIYSNVITTSVAKVADWAYYNDTNLDETEKATLQSTYLTYKVVYHNEDEAVETTGVYNQTLATYEPTKDGYAFVGWYNEAGTLKWDFETNKVTSTTTNLYAKWIADYSAESTDDWNIGETTFNGPAVIRGGDTSGLYQEGNGVKITLGAHSYAGFEATFKTPIDATSEDKYVSFTAKGADASLFTVVEFNTAGDAETGATKACVTRTEENGYTTYVFRIAKGLTIGKFRITPLDDTTETGSGTEIIISNCTVGNYSSLRTGEDANTLFFTDSSLGATLGQVSSATNENMESWKWTNEKAYGNEDGSFKLTVTDPSAQSWFYYALTDADKDFLADDDYVVFYLYSTSNVRWFLAINYYYTSTGWEIMPQAWNRIVVPANWFKQFTWFIVHPQGQTIETNDVYLSKFVRYTADQVTKLENKGSEDTWTLGSTTFVGAPTISNGETVTDTYLAGVEHKKAYIIDGELSVTFVRTDDGYIDLKLANPIEVAANTEMYVTVTMYNYGRLDKLDGYFFGSGTNHFSYVTHKDIGGGYAKVTFKCDAKDSDYTITSVRLDVENHTDSGSGLATQFRIKDIVVDTKAN